MLFGLPEEADDSNLVNFNLTQPFDPMFSTILEEQLGTGEFGYESQHQQAETACTSVPSDNNNNMLDRKQFSCTSQDNDIQPSIYTVESTKNEPVEKADSDLDDEKLDKIQSDVEWSGGAKVLGKLPVPGRPTDLDYSRTRAYCARGTCGFGVVWQFFSHLSFLFSFSLSLGDGPI